MSSRLGGVKTLAVSGFLNEFEKGDLKRSIDIVQLFSHFGVDSEKKGHSYMARCPWHDDKTPSLSIDREKGLYNCFGCGESGDVFDLVQRMQGVEFKEALSFLKDYTGKTEPKAELSAAPAVKIKQDESLPNEKAPLQAVSLQDITNYYQKALIQSKAAVNYLKGRGIGMPSLLNRFSAGYSTGNLSAVVSSRQIEELTRLGIFTEKGTEFFKGCVVFPLYDEASRAAGLYGRKISDKAKLKHLYLKGPHKGLFNRKALSVYREEIIITESIIDALSLIQLGIENVTSLYGTNGFTDELLDALKAERAKTITIALDNDNAGVAAAAKLKDKLLTEGFSVKVIFPDGVKDWNQALLAGMSKDEFLNLIENSAINHPEEKSSFSVEELNGRYHFSINGILYRLSGVKDNFITNLRVNIRAEKEDLRHIDNVDLFSARSRSMFSIALGRLFGCESARIEKDLFAILAHLEDERDRKLFGAEETEIELSTEDKKLGMELLLDPDLLNRIENDMSTLGYVGEPVNKLLMYLAASSRKLDDPVSIIVISQSAAGKSYLIDTVKKLIPPEDVISVTSLSDQALNYMPESALMHKFLSLGEAVHSDVIDHQMREMLSGHELSRLVTGKDEKSGKMESKIVKKKVIVSAVMSSTTSEINPENASRSFVISTDESEAQTKEIHKRQRQKYSFAAVGLKEDVVPVIIKAHHAAQRLLTTRLIINPFAELLDFPAALMRTRRDHERFIDLIACVCHLRQFQKAQKEHEGKAYIECDLDDYSLAYEIMIKILPQTMSNFPKSAELLYEGVRKVIEKKAAGDNLSVTDVSVTQREIRESFGYEHNFVKRNMRTLVEYEYLSQRGGRGRGGRAYYRLNSEGPITGFDLTAVPTPTQMRNRVKSGSEKVVDLNHYREAN